MTLAARSLRTDRSGNVALEFALVGPTFLGLILFLIELGFTLYAQTALDYAIKETARQFQTGQQTVTAGSSQSSLQSNVFCPFFSHFLPCNGVVLTMKPVTTFQAVTMPPTTPADAITVDPGLPGNLMLMQVFYTPPFRIWPLGATMLVATAAYLNE